MTDELWLTPPSWAWVTLDDVALWSSGGTPKSTEPRYYRGEIPWLIIGDLNDGVVTSSAKTITPLGLENSSAKYVESGAVMIALYGSIGKLGIAGIRCTTNQAIAFTRSISDAVHQRFLFYYLKAVRGRLLDMGKGGTQANISQTVLKAFPICVAPLAEQRRIVAKLEKLLGQVGACQQRLARIPALLKRFRQSVLAAACSGRLTADWREENDSPEPASELLARLSKKRERKATATAGKRRVLPAPLDVDGLPDLPDFWQWATLDQIVEEGRPIIYGIIKPGPHDPIGVPYVRVFEMKDGKVAPLVELKRASFDRASKFTRATLKTGDLLISKDGTIGRVAIVPPELEGGNITQHLVRASVHPFLNREFVAHAIRSQHSQDWLVGEKKGVALQGVNVEDFRRLPLPIPPLPEQQEIVRRLKSLFALADQIEGRLTAAQRQVNALTPSLLARAFAGKLVPQDPADEPAEKLLERIKAQRACKSPRAAGSSDLGIKSLRESSGRPKVHRSG